MSAASEIIDLVAQNSDGGTACGVRPYFDRLVLGDCTSAMRSLPSECVDFVLTDPPYVCNYRDRGGRRVFNDDNSKWIFPAFFEIYRLMKPDSFCVSFYGWNKVDKFFTAWRECGLSPVGHFTFLKSYSSSVGYTKMCHEGAYLLVKGKPERPVNAPADTIPWKYTGNKLHPTQKPVSALTPLIEAYSKPGDLVLDPFGGSGSTAVAAIKSGRHFVLFEKDEQYFTAARMRLLAYKAE